MKLRVKTPTGRWLVLTVSSSDSVLGTRQVLRDLPSVCRWTNYSLVLCHPQPDTAEIELNEYEDLQSYDGIADPECHIEMRCLSYQASQSRFHVRRFHELLVKPQVMSEAAMLFESQAAAKKASFPTLNESMETIEIKEPSAAEEKTESKTAIDDDTKMKTTAPEREVLHPTEIVVNTAVSVAERAAVDALRLAASATTAVYALKR